MTLHLFLLLFSLLASCATRQEPGATSHSQPVIEHAGYSLAYDGRTRNASWVHETITADSLEGSADRNRCDFMEDPQISSSFRATKIDYQESGFDRGHLRPAADAKASPDILQETFYLSNICPQVPKLNRGYWSQLEKYVRTLASQYRVLHVYTGPLYLPQTEADGKRYVKYQVIGPNDVAVPTHFFKVIVAEKASGAKDIEAYIVPNRAVSPDTLHSAFRTTLEKVERAAGVLFSK